MITSNNYHYLHRIAKRTVPFLKKENRFTQTLKREGNSSGNESIAKKIREGVIFMAGRYGSTESQAILNYYLTQNKTSDFTGILNHLTGKMNLYWKHDDKFLNNLVFLSGFFPNNPKQLTKFVEQYNDCSKDLDILGIWNGYEEFLGMVPENCKLVQLRELEPWFYENPWSKELKDKKVLVIHPFENSIQQQYNSNREKLYKDKNILPIFELKTIKAVQTIAGQKSEFKTWFDALDYMKKQIDNTDFDIALIGCGAYGLPLASYIKRNGRSAIHMGGVLQLMFGVKGTRWERWKNFTDIRLENGKYWIPPSEIPKDYKKVEGGCYW